MEGLFTLLTQRPAPTNDETVTEVKLAFTMAIDAQVSEDVMLTGPSGKQPLKIAFCAEVQSESQQQFASHELAVKSQTQTPISVFS